MPAFYQIVRFFSPAQEIEMKDARQSSVMQGEFGRITLNLTARDLVEHAHSEYNFIFKIGGGDTGFKVNGATFELSDDNAIFVNPWEPHAKLNSHGAATLVLTALLNGPWMSQVLGVQSPPRAKMFPSPLVQLSPEVRECVVRIAISMTSGLEMSDEERTPILRDLVRAVAVAYCDQEFSKKALLAERPMDARIMRATRFMRENAASNPSLEDAAAHVGLSRSRFFEQFKNCLGASPQQYLDWERMTLATRMLSDPNSRVTQVSDELGFSAPSHFARFFAQHIGFPPSDFKRGMLSQASPDQA